MKVVICQHDITWENKQANHLHVSNLLRQAAPPRNSLVVLPEMFATGFSMQLGVTLDSSSCDTQNFLGMLAKELGVYIAGGLVGQGQTSLGRNECVVFNPQGEEIAKYCKQQPFTLSGEHLCHEAGETACLFDWSGFRVAPFICYDLRFPELFRRAVAMGANLFLVIASWPMQRIKHWDILLRARAIENQAYVVGVNRCGKDPSFEYVGHSQIIAPNGEIILRLGASEIVAAVPLALTEILSYREQLPFLVDMGKF